MAFRKRSTAVQRRIISTALGFQVPLNKLHKYRKILEERGLTIDDALESEAEFAFLKLWFTLNQQKP